MKYLGIDYGSKRIGIAVSDAEGKIAFPRMTVGNNVKFLSTITQIIKEENIEHIIIGDTLTLSGRANPVTETLEKMIERISRMTNLPVTRAREAGSSGAVAEHAPRGEKHNDAAAAAFILQRFFDMRGPQ
ncbi:MAG: Holliday junction resolvase RuvX [bacterium]|nr:Holliday junction resolvase RuvX [bacterium]